MNPEMVLTLLLDLYANLQAKTAQYNQLAAQYSELEKQNADLEARLAELQAINNAVAG